MSTDDTPPKKAKRGFAAMTPERRRLIAQRGGKNVPAEKRGFSKDKALAKEAGRKGGQVSKRSIRDRYRDL